MTDCFVAKLLLVTMHLATLLTGIITHGLMLVFTDFHQDPAFSDSIRHVMDGSLPNSLKHIIR